jgi:hypothetical protein
MNRLLHVVAIVGCSAFVFALPLAILLELGEPWRAFAWSGLASVVAVVMWVFAVLRFGAPPKPRIGAYIGFLSLLVVAAAYIASNRTQWQFGALFVSAAVAFFGIYALLCGAGVAVLVRKAVR